MRLRYIELICPPCLHTEYFEEEISFMECNYNIIDIDAAIVFHFRPNLFRRYFLSSNVLKYVLSSVFYKFYSSILFVKVVVCSCLFICLICLRSSSVDARVWTSWWLPPSARGKDVSKRKGSVGSTRTLHIDMERREYLERDVKKVLVARHLQKREQKETWWQPIQAFPPPAHGQKTRAPHNLIWHIPQALLPLDPWKLISRHIIHPPLRWVEWQSLSSWSSHRRRKSSTINLISGALDSYRTDHVLSWWNYSCYHAIM